MNNIPAQGCQSTGSDSDGVIGNKLIVSLFFFLFILLPPVLVILYVFSVLAIQALAFTARYSSPGKKKSCRGKRKQEEEEEEWEWEKEREGGGGRKVVVGVKEEEEDGVEKAAIGS